MSENAKIKTSFPGLQQANGVKPSDMEVITAGQQPNTEGPVGDEATIKAAEEEKQRLAAEAASAASTQPAPTKIDFSKLSDEEKAEALMELTGGKIKSLDDLKEPAAPKSKEELEAEAEQRKNNALNHALSTGKVKKADYDSAIVNSAKTDRELALSAFTSSLREDDKDLTDEDAEDIFKATYHEELGQDDRLYKIGQREIAKLAANYRKENFSFLDNIEPEYEAATQSQAQYKAYKGQLKKISAEIPKEMVISSEYVDIEKGKSTFEYKIPVDEKVLAKVLANFSSEETFGVLRNFSKNGTINEKELSGEINSALKAAMYDVVIPELLRQNSEKVEERMMVILGNKRNPNQQLNDGRQNTTQGQPKANVYTGLHEAMKKQKV